MTILDRYIIQRFLWNFAVLFALLFLFAISVDLTLQLDRFTEAAGAAVEAERFGTSVTAFAWAVFSFYGPRVFQFYAYLVGLVSIAAMGFALAQMNRNRELVAMLAAGVGLHRVAVPIVVAAFALNLLQLVNQEIMLPRLAPLLVRDHRDILREGSERFPVELTRDGSGHLVTARAFDPQSDVMEDVLVLERDDAGIATRRIVADRATWDEASRTWRLEGGLMTERLTPEQATSGATTDRAPTPVDRLATDLGPKGIKVRQSALYGQMLSLAQIREMEAYGEVDPRLLSRYRYGRLAAVLVNMLMLLVTLPSFLLREPANLLKQSVVAAAIGLPGMLAAFVGMTMDLPGIPAAVGVFLPVAILVPIAAARLGSIRT